MVKKVVALALAIVLTLGIATTSFAATPNITGMAGGLTLGFSGDPHLGDVNPQDRHVVYIDLVDTMFTWENHTPDAENPQPLTSAQIRRANIEVRASNSRVLDGITINASQSRVEVRFARELVGTREVDFDFDVILTVNRRQMRDQSLTLSGTLLNPEVEVFADSEREDISRGEVAVAQESIRTITFEIGEGVSLITRMSNNGRLYAVATATPDNRDEDLFRQHREINEVINIAATGVASGSTVRFDRVYHNYFVYSADGTFLGRGNEDFTFANKFYFATARLAVETTPTTPAEPTAPGTGTGGTEQTPPATGSTPGTGATGGNNANHNPPTGR